MWFMSSRVVYYVINCSSIIISSMTSNSISSNMAPCGVCHL